MPIHSDTLDSWDYPEDENEKGVPYHESSVEDFQEDGFWADFQYEDGEDPFQEYDDQSPEWD